MSEEQEEELGPLECYEPNAIGCADLEGLIFDPLEFAELTQSIAAVMRDGAMYVLDRETLKWRNVEASKKEEKKGGLRAIKPEPKI